jgi:CubicO group peptidase (beta-lactamase class C family)
MSSVHPLRCITAAALALTITGCSAADPRPPEVAAPRSAPPVPPPSAAKAAPPPAAQAFASDDVELAFRDPERRKKLESAFAAIDAIAQDEITTQGLPSVAVGVVIDGDLAYAKGFGAEDRTTNAKPDADTVYRIGSITKSFTALAVLSLRDEGALSIDDPLSRWIPEASGLVYPTRDSPPITLRQMLTHTSGLPRLGAFSYIGTDRGPTEAEVVKSLAGFALESAPGTRHAYSNLGFSLLGIAASHAARAPFREVVKKRLLAPLGMSSSVWDRSSVPAGRLATAHVKSPSGEVKPVEHWQLGDSEGSGGIYSSVRDMARYVALQLAAYPPRSAPESGPVKRSTVREAHFNAVKSGLRVRLNEAPRKGESLVDVSAYNYGYGWVVEQTCELDEIVWHNGGTEGYRANIAFLPGFGVGVIALINSAGASSEAVMDRALLALHKSGGLSRRTQKLPAKFDPVMKKLLDVYNTWDEAGYKAMLTPGRSVTMQEEKVELEGYKKFHGACKGFTPRQVNGPNSAVFTMDCERGSLSMDILLAPDGLITGFSGTSRGLPVPPELRTIGDRVVGLIKKWDEGVYKKHLAKAKKSRDDAIKTFDHLRASHGSCSVKSMTNEVFDKKLVLACERGSDLTLTLSVDPKSPDIVTAYSIRSAAQGTCPVR